MSRSGYSEDFDDGWQIIRWRGAVASAIRGKRGQAFLREMLEALDVMPERRLIKNELRKGGDVCAIGSVGARRGVDLEALDPEDHAAIAEAFGIAEALVQEIEYENDECWAATPERRWELVREWVVERIKPAEQPAEEGR